MDQVESEAQRTGAHEIDMDICEYFYDDILYNARVTVDIIPPAQPSIWCNQMSAKKSKNLPVARRKRAKAPRKSADGLTALQIEFCNEYALNGYKHQTQAYIRASNGSSTYAAAATAASRLLQNKVIKSRLARMRRKSAVTPYAVTLDEIQRDLYDAVQITMGRKSAPRIDRDRHGLTGKSIQLQNFDGMAAISALDKLAKLSGGYDAANQAGQLKVNINIDIGDQTAGPHPTVSTVVVDQDNDKDVEQ